MVVGNATVDRLNATFASQNVPRLVIISQGGENSSMFRRILTSHNFLDLAGIDSPIFVITESETNIFVGYKETPQSPWKNLQINKRASQAWLRRTIDPTRYRNNTAAAFDTPIPEAFSLTSETPNPPSIPKSQAVDLSMIRHFPLLTMQNKTIQNDVLKRQNFTTQGISFLENFLNITGPIFDMYPARVTADYFTLSADQRTTPPAAENANGIFNFRDRIGEETRVTLQIDSTHFMQFNDTEARLVQFTGTQTGLLIFLFESSGSTRVVIRPKPTEILGRADSEKKILDNTRRVLQNQRELQINQLLATFLLTNTYCDQLSAKEYA